jgi:hypothetical protein
LDAWRNAHDVVVCVPADEQQDAARAAAWLAGGEQRGRLIHLGVDGSQPMGVWSGAGRMLHLADVYRALRESNEQRKAQIERARAACDDYAAQWSQPRTVPGPGTHRVRDQRVS